VSETSDLIQSFGQTVTVNRRAAGAWVAGDWVPGTPSTFDITMSVQPLTDKELLDLPEAQRTRRTIKGYTDTFLNTTSKEDATEADLVEYDGRDFEVQRVEQWQGDFNFWKVFLQEVNT